MDMAIRCCGRVDENLSCISRTSKAMAQALPTCDIFISGFSCMFALKIGFNI